MTSKAPSFSGLQPASETSSRVKSRNKRSDTKHEIALRSELWRSGLRFRKNVQSLPGKPDIVFPAAQVVVFCDGDFWHGRNWRRLKAKLETGANASYWLAKIASNRRRDKRVSSALQAVGWQVIRVWETDFQRDPKAVALLIEMAVRARLASLK